MAEIINPRKLHSELKEAGITVSGCASSGLVWNVKNEEIQDREEVIIVINAHDPAELPPKEDPAIKDLKDRVTALETSITIE